MEDCNKTFEFHYEIENVVYTVRGIITSFIWNEDVHIENVEVEYFKDAIFNVSLTCSPAVDLKIFDDKYTLVYLIAYKGKEGQLGYIHDNKFIEENVENLLVRSISVSILELLLINDSGHFTD